MKGNKRIRLITFMIGVPLFVSLAFFSFCNYIIFHCAVIIACAIATNEIYEMLKKKITLQPKPFCLVLPPLLATCVTILSFYNESFIPEALFVLIGFFAMLIFTFEIFANNKENADFHNSFFAIAGSFFLVIYPGVFFSFISRLALLKNPQAGIAIFLLMIFGCDSMAWATGVLFGKNNRGLIKVSPNKSIAGYLGGYIGSMLAGAIGIYFYPNVFGSSIPHTVILAVVTATACIIGDLAESVLKRSTNSKDAGIVIPGRGGMLDSVDSMIFAAPFYYFFLELFFIN
ncbi:MAG: phosphatidate cytidylyltransferase [Treponemataceae bacterium]